MPELSRKKKNSHRGETQPEPEVPAGEVFAKPFVAQKSDGRVPSGAIKRDLLQEMLNLPKERFLSTLQEYADADDSASKTKRNTWAIGCGLGVWYAQRCVDKDKAMRAYLEGIDIRRLTYTGSHFVQNAADYAERVFVTKCLTMGQDSNMAERGPAITQSYMESILPSTGSSLTGEPAPTEDIKSGFESADMISASR